MSSKPNKPLIIWGSYDTGKPRVRLLIKAAGYLGYQISEIHYRIWEDIEDKSQIKSVKTILKIVFSTLLAYPGLIYRYLKAPEHQDVIVPYLGLFDIFILWPFAKLRGSKIHWDMFISMYDTIVNDRRLLSRHNPLAWLLYATEWLACRLVDSVFMDTKSHAIYIARLYHLPDNSIMWVPVGVEENQFPRQQHPKLIDLKQVNVLFYGQFIPLHGIDIILDAAKLDQSKNIQWTLVGKGQLSEHINKRITRENINTITCISWTPYDDLSMLIQESDICLGIFGVSQKSQNVIPNKVYQIMATGKPFVTADTPGIQNLKLRDNFAVSLCESGNGASLLDAIATLASRIQQHPQRIFQAAQDLPIFDFRSVSVQLEKVLNKVPAEK
jgi:glycosyltransferase involved in cell wall biosynthesis